MVEWGTCYSSYVLGAGLWNLARPPAVLALPTGITRRTKVLNELLGGGIDTDNFRIWILD